MNNEVYQGATQILKEINKTIGTLDVMYYQKIYDLINEAERIFLTGQGRSGLVARMFAMRLVHLGLEAYVIGETITPAIQKGDLLVACSGSGETKKVVVDCKVGRETGARVLIFSADSSSTLATLADYVVTFPGTTTKNGKSSYTQQFGGSLFEQSLLIFFDSLVYYLQRSMGIDFREMEQIHTNLE